MSPPRLPPPNQGGSLYGVVELDATLKNTITSLESATNELKKLATLDLDYKMPGLSAFRTDTEQMIYMLHGVCKKVEEALHERRNESQMMMNPDVGTSSKSNTSVGSSLFSSPNGTTSVSPTPPKKTCATVVYEFEVKIEVKK
uniref:Uncharacterized protein n=1 Tax=Panagrolaimus davidi TaxID=227884 RepID=A0A914PWT2_9BILA